MKSKENEVGHRQSNQYETLQQEINYWFKDIKLLHKALTHRSVSSEENNERLEFLGDAVLSWVIADWLYQRFPKANEGLLSRFRSDLVSGDALAVIGNRIGLGAYIQLGPGEMKSGGKDKPSILADACEALIGAIYLDGGIDQSIQFIRELFAPNIETLSVNNVVKDAKTRLQEYLQSQKLPLPEYIIQDVTGQPHQQTFTVACTVKGVQGYVEGKGTSRRKAEQKAAESFMEKFFI